MRTGTGAWPGGRPSTPAGQLFLAVLLPALAFNLILAYPLYALCAKILPPRLVVRREVKPAV